MGHFGFEYWMFTFCIYCMLGWIQESAIESLYHKRPINRGFLKGPYIPIYGVGGLALLFICEPFKDNGFFVFLVAMVSCTALEYFTGWLMETVFGKQFWDYSMFKLVYKNRISLVSSLFWGVMGLFVTYVVSGATQYVLSHLPYQFICITGAVISLMMTVDFFITARRLIDRKKISKTFSLSNISAHIGALAKRRCHFDDSSINTDNDYSDEENFDDRFE